MRFGLEEHVITKLKEVFEGNSKVDKAIVFGSRAKGNYRPDSDIDIAIKGPDITLDDILKIQVAFEEEHIAKKIDLVHYNTLKEKTLIEHIDRVGVKLYSRWESYFLGEACEIITGFPFKSEEYEANGSLKVVRGENVTIGKLRWDSEKHWNKSTKDLEKYFLAESDIVIGMDGSRVGSNRAIIRKEELPLILAQRVARLRAKKDFDQKFIWYNIYSNAFREYVESIHTGTSIPHISQKQIADFKISAPSKKEQTIIGEILNSIDDKIDLLHRQNKTLEPLAETLFRQWFDSEEWTGTLSEYIKVQGGYAFKSKDFQENGFAGIIKIKNISMGMIDITHTDFVDENVIKNIDKRFKIKSGDFLIAMTGAEIGKIGIVEKTEKEIWLNQRVGKLEAKVPFGDLIGYLALKSREGQEHILNACAGSAQENISSSGIEEMSFPAYNKERTNSIGNELQPLFQKIIFNQGQIRTLTQIRDALLPKLMSGEMRVKTI